MSMPANSNDWPELPLAAWRDSYETLHLWTQIAGKISLKLTPWLNHSWHVALYVTARGLTTSPIPDGTRSFQIDSGFLTSLVAVRLRHFPHVTWMPSLLRPAAGNSDFGFFLPNDGTWNSSSVF